MNLVKIIVCVKQILETRVPFIVDNSVRQKEDSPIYVMNPADRVALAKALQIKALLSGEKVTVITAGPARAEQTLRSALASGADEAIHLKDDLFEISDAYTTALALSKIIKEVGYTLVLCGTRSLDTGAGQVPAFLAELLGIPQVTGVTEVEIMSGERIKLWRRLEKGRRQVVDCPLPALYAIELSAGQPRYISEFTLRQSMKREIRNLALTDVGLSQADIGPKSFLTRVVSLSPPNPRVKKIYIPDGSVSASQRISSLFSGGLTKAKESNLLEGTSDYLVEQIIKYLVEERLMTEELPNSEPGGRK